MPFQANDAKTKVFDNDRGLELFVRGSAPRSWLSFEITGLPTPIRFIAAQTVTEESRGPPGTYSGDPLWKIIIPTDYDGESLAQIQATVTEAMSAFKSYHGFGPDISYAVEFLPWNTDID